MRLLLILLTALPLYFASPALADELAEEVDTDEPVYAVQHRPFLKGHEFNVSFSVLPLDSLYIGLTLGFGYSYHFNPLWGWQIVHVRYSFDVNTPAVNELMQRFGVMASNTDRVQWLLDSNVLFKMLAGKALLGRSTLAGGEVDLIFGPAAMVPETEQVYFGLNAGLGFRAYLTRYFSALVEVRDYEVFNSNGVSNVLDVSVGASVNLR